MMGVRHLFLVLAISALAAGQSQPLPPTTQANSLSGPANANSDLNMLLSKIQQEAQGLNADVGKLRIERWKVDSGTKQQAAQNAASIQRNITAALPELMNGVQNAPQSLAANFKLYRNLNALYDVLAGLGETTGAFGKREEYDILGPHVNAFDDLRRSYGDYLQQLTSNADNRLAAAQQELARAAAAAQQPPKKIIVDDDQPTPAPAKKKTPKKKPAASATSTSSNTATTPK